MPLLRITNPRLQQWLTERVTWQDCDAALPAIHNIDAATQLQLADAYRVLERFLRHRVFTPGHPLRRTLRELGPAEAQTIIELAASLETMSTNEGFATVLRKIKSKQHAQEGADVLRFAARLKAQGCDPTFEPSLLHSKKRPDLFVRAPQPCFVELSESRRSDLHQDIWDTRVILTDLLMGMPLGFVFSGWLHRGLAIEERPTTVQRFQDTIDRAITKRTMEVLCIPDVLDLAVSPLAQLDTLQTWAKALKYEVSHFPGPRRLPIDPGRVWDKIRRKAKQLPDTTATLLVVYSSELLLHRTSVQATMELLATMMRSYPNISAIVLKGIYLPEADEDVTIIRIGEHTAVFKDEHYHTSCALLVRNLVARHALGSALQECLARSLIT